MLGVSVCQRSIKLAVSRIVTQAIFINVRAVRHAILVEGGGFEPPAHARLFVSILVRMGVTLTFSKMPACTIVSGFFLPYSWRGRPNLTYCTAARRLLSVFRQLFSLVQFPIAEVQVNMNWGLS